MKLGERTNIQVPPWSFTADYLNSSPKGGGGGGGGSNGSVDDYSVFFQTDSIKALQRYLASNSNDDGDLASVDAHTCDHFRMFEFKVRMCSRGRSHDWTECPFAHPGEKARRRDPRKFHYAGTACPDFRKGYCRKGDSCEFAHGVFECWLHPARYRTQPCKDGMNCTRRVCFFAHSPEQLRVLSPRGSDSYGARVTFMSPPESMSPATDSPPMSPMTGNSVDEMVASLRQLQLNKVKSMPSSWMAGSPRVNMTRSGYFSLPNTPTRAEIGYFDHDQEKQEEEDPVMERVESGRDLRAKMFEKLSKENPLDRVDRDPNQNPDLGWVSELVYTLETGSWRSVSPGVSFEYNCRSIDTFHNGDLHWLVIDLKGCSLISSFDLKTKIFRTFSPPPPRLPESRRFLSVLVVLEDCLCLCDNTCENEIVVWMMKEDCWRKEFVINKLVNLAGPSYEVVYPLKVFRDVDVLMRWDDYYLF
ncbi:hypothetical protein BUALT_Bualt09G0027200 [Buddleja alternifolia]|uniref:C3H1-type domain-containing protein n=1 Tax=Buddleja alternifolia TaxID=168488 RepID=A0AAV6X163_9LAMI|nr:hypothetical protein BUALT_Bualt09G0027200 [Buddleja alternifolia]